VIVLDTNVISEIMHPHPSRAVVAWINQQPGINLFITTISVAEIGYGLRVLADGKRRRILQNRFDQFITQGFEYSRHSAPHPDKNDLNCSSPIIHSGEIPLCTRKLITPVTT